MPRAPRHDHEGQLFHVMNRGLTCLRRTQRITSTVPSTAPDPIVRSDTRLLSQLTCSRKRSPLGPRRPSSSQASAELRNQSRLYRFRRGAGCVAAETSQPRRVTQPAKIRVRPRTPGSVSEVSADVRRCRSSSTPRGRRQSWDRRPTTGVEPCDPPWPDAAARSGRRSGTASRACCRTGRATPGA